MVVPTPCGMRKPALMQLRTKVVSAKAQRPRGAGFAVAGAAAAGCSLRSAASCAIKVPTFLKDYNTCTFGLYILQVNTLFEPGVSCRRHHCLPVKVRRGTSSTPGCGWLQSRLSETTASEKSAEVHMSEGFCADDLLSGAAVTSGFLDQFHKFLLMFALPFHFPTIIRWMQDARQPHRANLACAPPSVDARLIITA